MHLTQSDVDCVMQNRKGKYKMKKWVVEDWAFELTAIEGKAAQCRLGLEKGDKFTFSYACPAGMCPRVMAQVYSSLLPRFLTFYL